MEEARRFLGRSLNQVLIAAATLLAVVGAVLAVPDVLDGGDGPPSAVDAAAPVGAGVAREVPSVPEGVLSIENALIQTALRTAIGDAATVSRTVGGEGTSGADEANTASSGAPVTTAPPFNITIPPDGSTPTTTTTPTTPTGPTPPTTTAVPTNTRASIRVRARGATGSEQFEIWVGGTRIHTGTADTSFSDHPDLTTADGVVEVRFVNDGPTIGANRDLWIDYIEINGRRFESESPSTYALNYWDDVSGTCDGTEGYPRLDVLRCNGRFRYARISGGTAFALDEGSDPTPTTTQPPGTTTPPTTTTPVAVPGDARYVATNGSDSNPGTSARPWRTIQHAANVAGPGTTVVVRGGTYHESVHLSRSGTPGNWIEFRAAPGERPVVRATDNPGFQVEPIVPGGIGSLSASGKLNLAPVEYIAITGFELAGEGNTAPAGWASGVSIGYANHVRVRNNVIHGFPGGGVSGTQSDNLLVEGNEIHGVAATGITQFSGLSTYQSVDRGGPEIEPGYGVVFRNNHVHDVRTLLTTAGKQFGANYRNVANSGDVADHGGSDGHYTDANCIIVDDGRHTQNGSPFADYRSRTLIEGNRCENNMGRGVHVFESDHVTARGNTLRRNMGANRWYPAPSPFGFDPWEGYRWTGELNASKASDVRFENNVVDAAPGSYDRNSWNASNIVFTGNRYVGNGIATSRTDGASFSNETSG